MGLSDLTFNREPACATHADCSRAHLAPTICQASRCVELTNYDPLATDPEQRGDCRIVVGAENLDSGFEPFVFGAFANIDATAPESSVPVLNYKLAMQEFKARGGIPVAGESRLPVAVVCNSSTTAEAQERSLDHLVDTLGVSAVVASITDASMLKSGFEHVRTKAKPPLLLSPFGSTSALTAVHDDDLLWHLLPDVVDIAPAYVPLVERVESYVNPLVPGEPHSPVRVALVVATDFGKLDVIGTVLDEELRFNGKTAKENGPEQYLRVTVPYGVTNPNADLTEPLRELQAFKPHIVVSAAGSEFLTKILLNLEADWPESEQKRPFYVLSPLQANYVLLGLEKYDTVYQLRQRIVGINYAAAADPTLYDDYLGRLTAKYPAVKNLESTENYYDAVYLLLYAASAGARTQPQPAGSDLALGMHRLLSGVPYDVGPTDLVDALGYLEGDPGNTIALQGTLGPPDFDEHGGRRGVGSAWCLERAPLPTSGVLTWHIHFDALRYDPAGATLSGNFPCFPDF